MCDIDSARSDIRGLMYLSVKFITGCGGVSALRSFRVQCATQFAVPCRSANKVYNKLNCINRSGVLIQSFRSDATAPFGGCVIQPRYFFLFIFFRALSKHYIYFRAFISDLGSFLSNFGDV